MKYKLFIFDFDGTLVNTGEGIKKALEVFEDKLKLKHFPKEKAGFIVGPPIKESIARTHPELDKEKLEEYSLLFDECYDEVLLYGVEEYKSIHEVLDMIHEYGAYVTIDTAKLERQAVRCLEKCNLKEKIDLLEAWSKGTNKTQLIKKVIDSYDIPKDQIIAIGDSHFDGEAANANGIDFIAVKYGYGFGLFDDEKIYNPKYVVNSVDELKELIKSFFNE